MLQRPNLGRTASSPRIVFSLTVATIISPVVFSWGVNPATVLIRRQEAVKDSIFSRPNLCFHQRNCLANPIFIEYAGGTWEPNSDHGPPCKEELNTFAELVR